MCHNNNEIEMQFSQLKHLAYLQTAVVCYVAVFAIETAQVALGPYQALKMQSIRSYLIANAFCEKSFIMGLF